MMKMRRKKTKIGVLFLLFFGLANANAQQAITAGGGDASGTGGTIAYSLGQVAYTTNTGTGGSINQGVQQTYTIIPLATNEATPDIFMSVYPNPTTSDLTLEVREISGGKMVYQLFDIQGRLLESNRITDSHTQIYTATFPPATYFLKVLHENKMVQSFKLIKN